MLPEEEAVELLLRVEGMACARVCARHVESVLSAVPGVVSADVHFPTRRARLVVIQVLSSLWSSRVAS